MNTTGAQTSGPAQQATSLGEPLVGQILEFFGDSTATAADERRLRQRYPISCKMYLTPIDAVGAPLTHDSWTIFGKDLSRTGICFSHDFALPHRRLVISLLDPTVGEFVVEAEVAWTRPTPIGLFESGCRLTRKISGQKINLRP
jgi:hypothetical protein